MSDQQDNIQWFRTAAPYINTHRGKTFVILLSDSCVASDDFINQIHDIALLHHLGIKLVILHGSRLQIDQHLQQHQIETLYHHDVRICDVSAMPKILNAINEVRTTIESRLSMGLPNTPMSGADISVISGNFINGMPLGIIDGVDMQHAGKVRDIKHESIKQLLAKRHVVLLSHIGFSKTGEVFNLPADELATEVAMSLQAEKLIFISPYKQNNSDSVQISSSDCDQLISENQLEPDFKKLLRLAKQAIIQQVGRVHIIEQHVDGGLLQELFTREGSGTLITNLFYEGIHQASIDDIGGILELIRPLELSGTLVPRAREQLELEIPWFHVIEKEGLIIACVACIPVEDSEYAEIACLAVNNDYQGDGLGAQLLQMAEHQARKLDRKRIYIQTTKSSHWFIENGFEQINLAELPEVKQQVYNEQRRSIIMSKKV